MGTDKDISGTDMDTPDMDTPDTDTVFQFRDVWMPGALCKEKGRRSTFLH